MFLSLAQQLFLGRFTFLGHDHYWFLKWNQCKVARRASSHQNFTKPCRCIRYRADILKISCWQRWLRLRDSGSVKSGATTSPILPGHQLLAFLYLAFLLELTFHFRASQPGQRHRHYWEEEAFCKFWVDLRSPEVVVAEKSPVDDVQQDEAGRRKVKVHKLNCRQFWKSDVKIWDQIWTSWAEKIRETICQLCFWLIEL